MNNKILYGFILLITLISCGRKTNKSYPEADAVYLNLTKTFVLNKDGSIVQTVGKQQRLITYRAFQSAYGETRINYNPEFQKVEILKAVTTMADRQKINVPENGVNEVLPGFCADSKAYNHLREKVVSHTGLEREAVIDCAYSISTNAGIFPFLMGDEVISADCPIEKLTIVVQVPSGVDLNYKLFNSEVKPEVKEKKEIKTYTWDFRDVPQHVREIRESAADLPRLVFSSQTDQASVKKWITEQEAFRQECPPAAKEYMGKFAKGLSAQQQALKAQEVVINELNTLYIPANLIAFRCRTPQEVWQSNSGTPFEKTVLMVSILRSLGLESEVYMQYPAYLDDNLLPFIGSAEPFVKLKAGNEILFLSSTHLNPNDAEFRKPRNTISSLYSDAKELNDILSGEIRVSGALTLDQSGTLKGKLNAEFANACNPYYSLLRNPENTGGLLGTLSGKTESLSAQLLKTNFEVAKSDWVEKRGDYNFIALPESPKGVNSWSLNPMPLTRESAIVLDHPLKESYEFTLKVPEGTVLVNPLNVEQINPMGRIAITFRQTGNEIVASRSIEINKPIVPKEEYANFKGLLDGWNTQKYRHLILKAGK